MKCQSINLSLILHHLLDRALEAVGDKVDRLIFSDWILLKASDCRIEIFDLRLIAQTIFEFTKARQ